MTYIKEAVINKSYNPNLLYMFAANEVGFENYRLVGLPDTSTTASDVCTTTLDTAEFNMMIKVGTYK